VAKKTTPKKAPKAAAKKKAAKAAKAAPKKKVVKKTAKKATTQKAVSKKTPTKKTPAAKKSAKKVPVKKKIAKKTARVTKKKIAPKKTTPKGKAKGADPSDNGKPTKTQTPAPPKINRVVRPVPPPAAEPIVEDWTPLSNAKLRKVKTGITRKELGEFKMLLLERRAEIVGDVLNMEKVRNAGNGGDLSNMPLHMADVGSDNYEQEFTLGLVESERKLLVEIDRALIRIHDKTYGVCIVTGNPIPKARLEIKPWAKYSIEVVLKREKLGLHSF